MLRVWCVAVLCNTWLLCAGQPPNIVTIIADDMGWNDVGFHGSNQIPTPNIDALAYNGVIINRHYTMPTCTPSRTAYLTGRYPIRTGMQGYPLRAGEPRGLPLEEVTLPERLRELGYVTRMIGKWHQGSHKSEYCPTQRGFDSFLGYWNGYISYFNHSIIENGIEGYDFHRDNCLTSEHLGQYVTDVFTDEAVDIINSHDTGRPLYLHLAHLAVHSGNDGQLLEVPDPDEAHQRFSYIQTPERRLYAEMVSKLDESVGRVVTALSDSGVLNNTIILFISDNGAQTFGTHENFGSNWPLRGLKFTLSEGGVRNVAALWSPTLNRPGHVTDQLFHLTDWLPTLYSAAGGDVSLLGLLDGVDQWASLINKEQTTFTPRTQAMLNIDDQQDMEALIDSGWKITRGVYGNGVYDGYFGDDGRGRENPAYNITDVLHSDVNRAIGKINDNRKYRSLKIDETTILEMRSKSTVNCDLTVSSRIVTGNMSCVDYCLYDIINDPCETNDLASVHVGKVEQLSAILNKFREVAVPQNNMPLDPSSNPSLHDGGWVSWLDDPGSSDQCNIRVERMSNRATNDQSSKIISSVSFMFWLFN